MSVIRSETAVAAPSLTARRTLAIAIGALATAIAAQVAIPVPGSPVPITLQVVAVLTVGGLLGPRWGAASLGLYLLLGISGLPVFAPGGAPGIARMFGPTGGYLLAYPLAAALVGLIVRDARSWARIAVAMVVGLVTIHAGGVSQLMVITGDWSAAVVLGSFTFLGGDVLKLAAAGLLIRRFSPKTSALR